MIELLLAGIVQGLVTWGALRVELRYLRRDVDKANARHDARDARELAAAAQSARVAPWEHVNPSATARSSGS